MALESRDPATGELVESFAEHSTSEVERRLARAKATFDSFKRTRLGERTAWLTNAAKVLEDERARFARVMTEEMGKPLKAAVAEVEKCARTCRHYAEHAERYLADEPLPTDKGTRAFIRYLPLGPVLAVMPWNFPFWQVIRFAAPALAAGNVGLLKHASNVPRSALALEEVFKKAGFPEGAFQTLLIGSAGVKKVIEDPRIVAVTLTGSAGAGSKVAEAAGGKLKKTVLELGGSDPFVVMPSANLDEAVKTAVTARNLNNGQSCIAAKRFIVHAEIYDAFERRFVEAVGRLKVGAPMEDDTDVGPLVNADGLDTLVRQVEVSVKAGARLLVGGKRLPGKGYFFSPAVLADPQEDSPAWREEIFGPVAILKRAKDVDDAIRLANDTEYGLGSSVWTTDPTEQRRFIDELEAGQTFINAMVASDPRLPFGGVKNSGYGRELSALGMREFMNAKTISINESRTSVRSSAE